MTRFLAASLLTHSKVRAIKSEGVGIRSAFSEVDQLDATPAVLTPPWQIGTDPCGVGIGTNPSTGRWKGVVCPGDGTRLTVLNPTGLGLTGSVDFTKLITLDLLTSLWLHTNGLSGKVDLSKLPDTVKEIDLSHNAFTGSIDLTRLPILLAAIKLNNNKFDGGIDLRRLPGRLAYVHLNSNALSGSIDLLGMTSSPLVELHLHSNAFTSYVNLTELPAGLMELLLSKNAFSGIANLTELPPALVKLHMDDNHFGSRVYPGSNAEVGFIDLTSLPSSLEELLLQDNDFNDRVMFPEAFPSKLNRLEAEPRGTWEEMCFVTLLDVRFPGNDFPLPIDQTRCECSNFWECSNHSVIVNGTVGIPLPFGGGNPRPVVDGRLVPIGTECLCGCSAGYTGLDCSKCAPRYVSIPTTPAGDTCSRPCLDENFCGRYGQVIGNELEGCGCNCSVGYDPASRCRSCYEATHVKQEIGSGRFECNRLCTIEQDCSGRADHVSGAVGAGGGCICACAKGWNGDGCAISAGQGSSGKQNRRDGSGCNTTCIVLIAIGVVIVVAAIVAGCLYFNRQRWYGHRWPGQSKKVVVGNEPYHGSEMTASTSTRPGEPYLGSEGSSIASNGTVDPLTTPELEARRAANPLVARPLPTAANPLSAATPLRRNPVPTKALSNSRLRPNPLPTNPLSATRKATISPLTTPTVQAVDADSSVKTVPDISVSGEEVIPKE